MKAIFWIAWRYLWAGKGKRFISLISVISILGVAIGVAALIVVLAVMSGFDKDLKEKIVGNYSHIVIDGASAIGDYMMLLEKINAVNHVTASSPFIQTQALLQTHELTRGIVVRGIDLGLESKVTDLKNYLSAQNYDLEGGVFIGKELRYLLGLELNDAITLINPKGKKAVLEVKGFFNSGMYDYDTNVIFVDLARAQGIFEFDKTVSGISVKVDKLFMADRVKHDLEKMLGPYFYVRTWTERNKNFFAALQLEKITMFIILTLIVLVAAFNIISMLVVMVTEKTKDIGILKAVGMNASRIRALFTLEGLFIGCFGILLGTTLGVSLCLMLKKYQFIKLPADIYYLDRLPVSLVLWPDVGMVLLAALCISLISTIYPAKKAAGLNPVEALRYE
ncbi:MAG: hypothetical protein A2Y00_07930 [Omnitrophica WOR_2 bacterium GWF2_43_52]|nr:MAG: hypothetical protein A2Y01_04460 [Omnitrophica WOR_2 bacterium GWC2_44_8]OGX21366.1 MAG: hypothetical protein A2Y00_07930 [Omnitrophica WOR_2 bacterium GWF2_43_52]HAH22009.1 lipoprotein-releasing system transmembrane subunit LolC [Candidatus Omnitrophota bacterium]HBG62686.1 lipoprotein-releasing system transmembrane subunit LolC [Candidatus Omnitrophota bacterium]